MIHNNNEHTKQADSFDEVYGIDIGGIKEFNTAYEKWAKKNNIQSGWRKNKGQFNCKTIKE
jgi:hypothetical protein